MHQPFYRDDLSRSFLLPWLRLRCAKDYFRMAALLDHHPEAKVTFNLVPSLLDQIEHYLAGDSQDVYLDLCRRPAGDLSEDERAYVTRWMTESSRIRRVRSYPRYLELVSKREQSTARSRGELARVFSDQEILDLQIWFNLSWIDPRELRADPTLNELLGQGRDYNQADKEPILRKQTELMSRVVSQYREVQRRGQAELITSPYYHPILPLVSDITSARDAAPNVSLPGRGFGHPEDAREQLRLGIEAHGRLFERPPAGMWPPEAAIGSESAALVGSEGIRWIIGDEGVLARSLGQGLDRDEAGRLHDPAAVYTPYHVEQAGIDLVFRDAQLSNLIGFEYQNQNADQAVTDLVSRLHAIRERQTDDQPFLVVIALDGENCWDFYEDNGNPFLDALYQRIPSDRDLAPTTISAFLEQFPARRPLARLHAGSWINASLDTWIGDPEHNRAWELLAETRDFVGEQVAAGTDGPGLAQARREVLIAEGSDWFWWFGRSHDSGMDVIWDNLYRLHLRNAYQALNQEPPAHLFEPVLSPGEAPAAKRPERKIRPKLNGVIDDAEWNAGGYVDVTAMFGAMHPPRGVVRRVWFGHDDRNLYLRFDLLQRRRPELPAELRVFLSGKREPKAGKTWQPLKPPAPAQPLSFQPASVLEARVAPGGSTLSLRRLKGSQVTSDPIWQGQAGADPVAFAVPFEQLGLEAGETLELVALAYEGGEPREQLPPSGSIKLRVPGDVFQGREATPLKVLLVAAEVAPFAKVGGLADVAGALPNALHELGHDVRVVMPRYGNIDIARYGLKPAVHDLPVALAQQTINTDVLEGRIGDKVPVYFVDNAQFFGREGMYGFWDDDARFIYFSRASLEMLRPLGFRPDVIHVNDWHTAVVPNMLAKLYQGDPLYSDIATALTIHTLAFQGVFGYGALHLANLDPWGLIKPGIPGLDDIVNLLGRGLYFSDVVNTVSNRYAEEILTPEYGEHMDPLLRLFTSKLYGIVNGIDYEVFNPETDPNLAARYNLATIERKAENKLALQQEVGLPRDPHVPLIGLISRLYDQKGLDLIANIMWGLMRLNVQVVVLGAGDARYEEMFRSNAHDYPETLSVTIGFKPVLAQHIYAGSDMFLMPSRFEPCGLGQLISLRYGTIPIVRATGGVGRTNHDRGPADQ